MGFPYGFSQRFGTTSPLRMLLVILTTLASDGHGLGSGGVAGERWRMALGRAAAVAIPLRVFFEHAENVAPRQQHHVSTDHIWLVVTGT